MDVVDTPRMVALLSNPLRKQILARFVVASGPLTPKQVAGELGERLNTVSYHVRVLTDAGALALCSEEHLGNVVVHSYSPNKAFTNAPSVREILDLPKDLEEGT